MAIKHSAARARPTAWWPQFTRGQGGEGGTEQAAAPPNLHTSQATLHLVRRSRFGRNYRIFFQGFFLQKLSQRRFRCCLKQWLWKMSRKFYWFGQASYSGPRGAIRHGAPRFSLPSYQNVFRRRWVDPYVTDASRTAVVPPPLESRLDCSICKTGNPSRSHATTWRRGLPDWLPQILSWPLRCRSVAS